MERTLRPARKRPLTATRRWFQLHLSTALLLMLSAGVLMSLNLQQHSNVYSLVQKSSAAGELDTSYHVRIDSHGWPFWTDAQFTRIETDGSDFSGYTDFATSNELFKLVRSRLGIPEAPDWIRFINGGLGLAILIALAVVCEYIIRRRRAIRVTVPVISEQINAAAVTENRQSAEGSALPENERAAN